jgi:hypothetical protein
MGRRSRRPSLLAGSKARRIRKSRSPPPANLRAMNTSGGITSTAYLVAAKFSPQKTAARISETSATTVVLFLLPAIAPESTARARRPRSGVVNLLRTGGIAS